MYEPYGKVKHADGPPHGTQRVCTFKPDLFIRIVILGYKRPLRTFAVLFIARYRRFPSCVHKMLLEKSYGMRYVCIYIKKIVFDRFHNNYVSSMRLEVNFIKFSKSLHQYTRYFDFAYLQHIHEIR